MKLKLTLSYDGIFPSICPGMAITVGQEAKGPRTAHLPLASKVSNRLGVLIHSESKQLADAVSLDSGKTIRPDGFWPIKAASLSHTANNYHFTRI